MKKKIGKIVFARHSTPCRIATTGFREPAPEPHVHLSMYTALR